MAVAHAINFSAHSSFRSTFQFPLSHIGLAKREARRSRLRHRSRLNLGLELVMNQAYCAQERRALGRLAECQNSLDKMVWPWQWDWTGDGENRAFVGIEKLGDYLLDEGCKIMGLSNWYQIVKPEDGLNLSGGWYDVCENWSM